MIRKAQLCLEFGVKPQIAVYTDGDIENANRFLIKSGLFEPPLLWLILPGASGVLADGIAAADDLGAIASHRARL